MKIDIHDSRLTAKEKHLLRQIAHRLENWRDYQPPTALHATTNILPDSYRAEVDRVFGERCSEDGDMEARGQ